MNESKEQWWEKEPYKKRGPLSDWFDIEAIVVESISRGKVEGRIAGLDLSIETIQMIKDKYQQIQEQSENINQLIKKAKNVCESPFQER